MRFYLKLILVVGAFAWLRNSTTRRMLDNLAYEARVGFVCAFGTKVDRDGLIEYTLRLRAARDGYFEAYLAQERLLQSIQVSEASDEEDDGDESGPERDRLRCAIGSAGEAANPMSL